MGHKLNIVIVAFTLIGLFGCCFCTPAQCQEQHVGEETHHDHHAHDAEGIELGLGAGYVDLVDEDENALGLHLHLMKRLGGEGLKQYFGVGLGTEVIFAEHEHYGAMVSLAAYPWRHLVLTVSPGVVWAEHEGDWETEYATHIEAAYVFEMGQYDVGPVIGYSRTDDEEHVMIGLHFGIHFGNAKN